MYSFMETGRTRSNRMAGRAEILPRAHSGGRGHSVESERRVSLCLLLNGQVGARLGHSSKSQQGMHDCGRERARSGRQRYQVLDQMENTLGTYIQGSDLKRHLSVSVSSPSPAYIFIFIQKQLHLSLPKGL